MQSFTHLFKKALFITVLCTLSLTSTTHAYSLTDAKKQIQSLTAEIVSLKKQLGALALTATTGKTISAPLAATSECSTTTPSIRIISPNGGEVYQAGSQVVVQWNPCNQPSTGVFSVSIGNGSGFGTQIAANLPVTQTSYTWTIPSTTVAGQYKMRVYCNAINSEALCNNNNLATSFDESDASFTIDSTNTIANSTITIAVSPTTPPSQNIVAGTANVKLGEFTITSVGINTIINLGIGTNDLAASGYLRNIRILVGTQQLGKTVAKGAPNVVIGFDGFRLNLGNGEKKILSVYADIASTTPNGSNIQVNIGGIGQEPVIGSQSSVTLPIPSAAFANTITVQSASSTCASSSSITVVSPNGGEFFRPGSSVPLQWSSCNINPSSSMAIDLVSKNAVGSIITYPLLASTANDGSEFVTLPTISTWSQMVYGNTFKIVVRQRTFLGATGYQDQSDQVFTVAPVGVSTVMSTPSYTRTTNTNGQVTSVTYTIPLKVSAIGETVYLKQLTQLANTVSGSSSFAFVFQNSTAPAVSDVTSNAVYTLSSSDASEVQQGFRIDDGDTKHFTLTVTLLAPTVPNSSYRVALKQLQVFYSTALLSQQSIKFDLVPTENYRTDYQLINN